MDTALPLPAKARFDLHMHSTRSDGMLAPDQVLAGCAEGGLDVIALTDHDSPPALAAGVHRHKGHTVRVLHAAEVSGAHAGREFHLLVYFRDAMPESFVQLLTGLSQARADRYRAAVEKLGLDGIAPPDALADAGQRAITRVHLSRAIVDAGHAHNVSDAFDRYTATALGNVPLVQLPFTEAIRIARQAGGLTSWAHPPVAAAREHLADFVAAGLQGLEGARPSLRQSDRSVLLRLAHKHGLLVTGGSDFHGFPWQRALGNWSFPMREARPFARALGLST